MNHTFRTRLPGLGVRFRPNWLTAVYVLIATFCWATVALAQSGEALRGERCLQAGGPAPMVEFHGEFASWFFWRNDKDFESTIPYYGAEGQSVGQASSFLRPQLTYRPANQIELFYEAELGLNIWSRNDPDQQFPGANDYMVLKHKELWAEVGMDRAQLKVGYQRLRDPSDLYLSHWAGGVALTLEFLPVQVRMLAAQLPDDTFEGVRHDQDNFVHDNVTGGLECSLTLPDQGLALRVGGFGMYDHRVTGRPLVLFTPFFGATLTTGPFDMELAALVQAGSWEDSGVAQIDQAVLAWAATASLGFRGRFLDLNLTSVALSPDDNYDGNRQFGAFFYSGKNHARTRMFTEDELRDRGDNFDEAYAARWGSFFVNRAGLSLTELSVVAHFSKLEWVKPELVVGAGFALNPANAGGYSYLGLESDLVVRIQIVEKADLVLAGQLFFPGKASAVFIHSTGPDPVEERTLQMHGFQVGTQILF